MPVPASLSKVIEELMAKYGIPGSSIAVINDHRLAWSSGFGVLETGGEARVTDETLFQCASISKPVSALIALSLVEQRKLALDEDVNVKLKSWHVPENEATKRQRVTLRRILSHTAGFNVHGFGGFLSDHEGPLPTIPQILDGVPPAKNSPIRVIAPPGMMWKYSGGGYVVLQQLITDALDVPFHETAAQMLQKIGMRNSTFEQPLPTELLPRATSGHCKGMTIKPNDHAYPFATAGGLRTTATDLALFVLAIQESALGKRSDVISPLLAREMLTTQNVVQGLGFRLERPAMSSQFSHNGGQQGHEAFLVGNVATGQGTVVMANANSELKFQLGVVRAIGKEYGWPRPPSPQAS
jgi:CubicO group peptidase (beta-lactamase class C family)